MTLVTPVIPVEVRIHRGQSRVLASDARIVAAIAGTGGGKTEIGPPWLMREIQRGWREKPETQIYLVAAPTHRLLRVAFRKIEPYLRRIGKRTVGEASDGWKASEGIWYLATGGEVHFGSADNPQSLEGVHYRAAWTDEWGQVDDDQHATVRRRLAFLKGRWLITTTPYPEFRGDGDRQRTWLRLMIDEARAGRDPETEVVNWPSWWNPAYDMEEIRRLRVTEAPWRFAMFYEGLLTRPEGAIYDIFTEAEHVVDPFPLCTMVYDTGDECHPRELARDWWPVYSGGDFGAANETAILWAALSPDDVLVIFGERFVAGKTLRSTAAALGGTSSETNAPLDRDFDGVGWGPMEVDELYGDPSAKQALIDLRDYGIPARGADNDVEDGIREVRERVATHRLLVVRGRCPDLVREVLLYRRGPSGHPIKVDDHAVDALRYLCMGIRRMQRGANVQVRYAS